ncbi:hypothetical protein [Dactylosporangium matsuzakiense]|uniref:Uncharacterized protein n=1 Tax=Dactylosporangium matsuzakiense TaxID=53360 RepID=A0A9W6NNY8_9ACTN|nr:hypothetical protein [Dactylosporangium matsuzakiense]GLL03731.1 hypothetical protein GCM10017581_054770 [Dactylosporangium matsuzakiense]
MNEPITDPAPVRRALTATELTAILGRIDAAASTGDLLTVAVRSVYDTLLAARGLTLATLPDGLRLDPRRYAIPTSQWHAISGAVIDRAAAWGTGPELALELGNVLPGSYDDPDAPVPDTPRTDRRPDLLRLAVSRDAVDVIAAATAHVQALAARYGPASPQHLAAGSSWLTGLSRLLSLTFGADTRVRPDGHLSLLVHTGSGFTYGLTFHGVTRRCTAGDGCAAVIADDGTASASSPTTVLADHIHQPSFPCDAPQPGVWSVHS